MRGLTGTSGPPWPIVGAFEGMPPVMLQRGDRVVNRTPMNKQYDGDGLRGRAQRYQLQTEFRGGTGEGANDKAWHRERVGGYHLQRAKARSTRQKKLTNL